MERDQYDEVLERFEAEGDENANESGDYAKRIETLVVYDKSNPEWDNIKERQQKAWFGLSLEQKHELTVAFRVVSGDKETISAAKVYDLMLAFGITMLPIDIKE